ncbi:hypothetical protein B9Z55_020653 [Caenorhabditis nigoni]|uniref:T20D4.11-like domain-containing protein n=1 Tax=Caenorhabditis nigoni TaxID=1611254 RepID=A0A2G5TPF5_9PELO|nr:hypothetical protein B9Z55_020653 [Caenorhabditis nigoni]
MLLKLFALSVLINCATPYPMPSTDTIPRDDQKPKECTVLQTAQILFECSPKVENILELLGSNYGKASGDPQFYQKVNTMCQQAKSCYGNITCDDAVKRQEILNKACDFDIVAFPEIQECMQKYFGKAFNVFLDNPELYDSYNFINNTLAERRNPDKKRVFMTFVQSNCTANSVDYFTKKYEKIVDAIATQPDSHDCREVHHQLNYLRCPVLVAETHRRYNNLSFLDRLFRRTQKVVKALDVAKKCMNNAKCIMTD